MERNSQGKNENKVSFNIIDIFILILVVACFVGIIIRIGNFGIFDTNDTLEDYRIHFSVSDIAVTSEDYFITGDTVTIANTGVVLGRLEMINSITPTEVYVKNSENEFVAVKYPSNTRVDVSGTVISKGKMAIDGYKLGGAVNVAAGDSFLVHTEHMNFVMTVTDIAKK